MPSYKSHIIHGELLFDKMDKKIDINKEELKEFSVGPDVFIVTDYKTFMLQHSRKTKEFFEKLLKIIKTQKLCDNPKVMAFLYGQIDHFALDCTLHPYIYYMTEGIESETLLKPHALIEMWIDDYIVRKYKYKNKEAKTIIFDSDLKHLINTIYKEVYNLSDASVKFRLGVILNKLVHSCRKDTFLSSYVIKLFKTGDFKISYDLTRVLPYLNRKHEIWQNPETSKKEKTSFDELWIKSLDMSQELVSEVNNYIYKDISIEKSLLLSDISYDTALPCKRKQTLKYIKKY